MIVFYVSGHGYGHAARAGAVIEALWELRPGLHIAVRTQAPRMMFPDGIEYYDVQVDSAIVESADALSIDIERSLANIRELVARSAEIVEREVRFLLSNEASAIAADIPFLAGTIARHAGVRAVAMGNFTWDWIFGEVASPDVRSAIRRGYGEFTEALRFPLSHDEGWDIFPKVSDVRLVTPRSKRPRSDIRQELGIGHDRRPTVLIGGRVRLTAEVLDRIKRECAGFAFLTPDMHESFSDLLRASDIVVSKIGYSIAAECIAEQKRLLFPPRDGFREESILLPQARRYLCARAIPNGDWSRGDWKPHLLELLHAPAPPETLQADGAAMCAQALLAVMEQ